MSTTADTVETHEHHGPAAHTYHPHPIGLGPLPLGIVVFLASEIGLFGAFFLWYGHARLFRQAAFPWPAPGYHIPANSTSINTAILVASSFTCEAALLALFRQSRAGLKWWLVATFVLGATFLGLQVHEYLNIGFLPSTNAQGSIFFSLTGLHGAHVFIGLTLLLFCIIRSWRGHFSSATGQHTGLLVTSIYWHFVDVVWILLYTLVYLLPTHPG
jgi:cytochrome c oxidase subunit III